MLTSGSLSLFLLLLMDKSRPAFSEASLSLSSSASSLAWDTIVTLTSPLI